MTTANMLESAFVWCSSIYTENTKSQAQFYTEVNGFTNNDGLTINNGVGKKLKTVASNPLQNILKKSDTTFGACCSHQNFSQI